MKTLAVFDIGSNTVLVTVGKKLPEGPIEILLDEGEVVRLSEGLQEGGRLREDARQRVLVALKSFRQKALELGAKAFLAAGTAAFRRAADGVAFAQHIEAELNIPVRILSGEEEAQYSYESARADFQAIHGPIGMIDIGGGSTEFVFGPQGPRFSLPIGTVRLTEAFISEHPISDAEWIRVHRDIHSQLKALPSVSNPLTWAAVAATPASLAAVSLALTSYDPKKIHGYVLELKALQQLIEDLRKISIMERQAMPGMHPKRAELLPIGGLILAASMQHLKLPNILVSDHGLRYGILQQLLNATNSPNSRKRE